MTEQLRALGLVCTLKPGDAPSSSQLITEQIFTELRKCDVVCEMVRCVNVDIAPGVQTDMGDGDQWPDVRKQLLAADIVILATPTWLGHMSSVAQRVLERLDAELSETDDEGRPTPVGKVAIAAVVGNEDGAHKICADLFQALNDVGFTLPAQSATYWNGEAMKGVDYNDLDDVPEAVASTNATVARNAVYLARLLRNHPYPSFQ